MWELIIFRCVMRVIAKKTLIDFWKKHKDAEQPLRAWYHETINAEWNTHHDVKKLYKTASILKNNRVVFNIAGNKYRLIAAIHYKYHIVYIRFIGTHKEYDKIDANKI